MTFGLDTSVVLRLLVGEPEHLTAVAWQFITEATAGGATSLAVSDLVVAEAYHALRHHYRANHEDAVNGLRQLLGDARFRSTGVARATLAGSTEANPGLMDRIIHADYAREGFQLVTFDRGLGGLPRTHVLGD